MRIVRTLSELNSPLPAPVLTLGNFDGVHLGHREIFHRVLLKARAEQGTSAVLTFVPHPLKVLAPGKALPLINTYAEKERLIAASCIDILFALPFDAAMATLSPERFVDEVLVGRIGVRHLVVGYDYAFGRGRAGDGAFLQRAGAARGFSVEVVPPLELDGEVFSSTRIRQKIGAGMVAEVVRLLGRHFSLEGEVVAGARRGKQLGFPTANLKTEKELLPAEGVYAVKVRFGERLLDGVANIGTNPTFGVNARCVEVHLLDVDEDLYGRTLRVYFIERLRNERCFSGAAALAEAIRADVAAARPLLAAARLVEYREYLGNCREREEGRA